MRALRRDDLPQPVGPVMRLMPFLANVTSGRESLKSDPQENVAFLKRIRPSSLASVRSGLDMGPEVAGENSSIVSLCH